MRIAIVLLMGLSLTGCTMAMQYFETDSVRAYTTNPALDAAETELHAILGAADEEMAMGTVDAEGTTPMASGASGQTGEQNVSVMQVIGTIQQPETDANIEVPVSLTGQ